MKNKLANMHDGPMVDKDREREWEVEDALRTLTRAKEIGKDKKLMADVRKMAAKKMSELKLIT